MPVLHDYVSIVEAADVLGVHWETVKRLCREGRIPAEKVHNKWLMSLPRTIMNHDVGRGKIKPLKRDYRGKRWHGKSALAIVAV